nr:hypothetical protein [Clostridium paraputrificum]
MEGLNYEKNFIDSYKGMIDKYDISKTDISWIINNEEIPGEIKEKILCEFEKKELSLLVRDVESQVISVINEILKYVINDRIKVDDLLGYVYEKYEE